MFLQTFKSDVGWPYTEMAVFSSFRNVIEEPRKLQFYDISWNTILYPKNAQIKMFYSQKQF